MRLDKKKRIRPANKLKAKSKVKPESVKTPAGVAGKLQNLTYAQLKLEDRVAEMERRISNLELKMDALRTKLAEWAACFGGVMRDPKDFLPLSGDEC